MNPLEAILNNQQQIAQNPTRVIRTPLQTAYDNYLKAQNNAQNTKEDEWGSAIGHSINGIAKIIASQAIKNPYERAGATRNLDNFDDRQDAMVRNWALQRMKNRNDYVQQAREQLGMAREDENQQYNRELTAQQIAYKKAQDEIANKLNQDKLDLQRDIANFNKEQAIASAQNKPAELTPEEKLAQKIKEDETIAKAKAKREAQQELNKAISGQKAFEGNIAHLKDLSKNTGTILDRSIGGIASLFSGKDNSLTKANNSMSELVAQLRQAALNASGISGESDDKAQQAKINDIYKRVGLTDKTKSLTQAEVNGIINNIQNLYKQRVAEKQNLLDSFIDNNSVTWE